MGWDPKTKQYVSIENFNPNLVEHYSESTKNGLLIDLHGIWKNHLSVDLDSLSMTLKEENIALREENIALKNENHRLRDENTALKKQVEELQG